MATQYPSPRPGWPQTPRPSGLPTPHVPRSWVAGITVMVVLSTLLIVVAAWRPWGPEARFVDGPVSAIGNAPAVRLAYAFLDARGVETNGSFTVTDDGYATGTITDPGTGTATIMATPEGSAVFGDTGWWARRAPAQSAELRDRWVRPDGATAFPVDPAAALTPAAIAALISSISAQGEAVEDEGTLTVTSGAWTLQLSDETPRRVLALSGPIEAGQFKPAIADGAATVVPAGETYRQVDSGDSGFISMVPEPEKEGPAEIVRSDSAATMSGRGTPPSGAPTASPAPDGPPPAQADLPSRLPTFSIEYHYEDPCVTRTCGWSVTVTNTGKVPGRAFVTLVETPGSTHGPFDLGVIEPARSVESPTAVHTNQAIGTGGKVRVWVDARLFSPETHADEDKLNRVTDKEVPSYAVWEVLARVGEHANDVLDIMSHMLDAGAKPDKVPDAVDNAIDWDMLPHLTALSQAGPRAQVWGALAEKLLAADEGQLQGYLREVYFAIDQLNAFPQNTVSMEKAVREDGRLKRTDVMNEPPGPGGQKQCYQVKSTAKQALIQDLNKGIDQLNGGSVTGDADPIHEEALNDCAAMVRIYVEATSSHWNRDKEGVMLLFRKNAKEIDLCSKPELRFDGLVVTTGKGTFTLTKDDICG